MNTIGKGKNYGVHYRPMKRLIIIMLFNNGKNTIVKVNKTYDNIQKVIIQIFEGLLEVK